MLKINADQPVLKLQNTEWSLNENTHAFHKCAKDTVNARALLEHTVVYVQRLCEHKCEEATL